MQLELYRNQSQWLVTNSRLFQQSQCPLIQPSVVLVIQMLNNNQIQHRISQKLQPFIKSFMELDFSPVILGLLWEETQTRGFWLLRGIEDFWDVSVVDDGL